jgi:uncharacterized protein
VTKLVASTCPACHMIFFPPRATCAHCHHDGPLAALELSGRGRLYSATTLHVGRDGPKTLGYVDLEEGVRVLVTLEVSKTPITEVVAAQPDVRVEARSNPEGHAIVVGSILESASR